MLQERTNNHVTHFDIVDRYSDLDKGLAELRALNTALRVMAQQAASQWWLSQTLCGMEGIGHYVYYRVPNDDEPLGSLLISRNEMSGVWIQLLEGKLHGGHTIEQAHYAIRNALQKAPIIGKTFQQRYGTLDMTKIAGVHCHG